MSHEHLLDSLSDDELLRQLTALMDQHRQVESEVVAHIAEVDERKLYLGEGCSSMHSYCTEVLHLSEAGAYLRIAVARASRRFPVLLVMLADGRLHLSGIAKLAPQLTAENLDSLLPRAVHQSKREIEKLVAEIAPKPDVPSRMRKLPTSSPPLEYPELRPGGVDSKEAPRTPPADGPGSGDPRVFEKARPAVIEPIAPARYKVEFTASSELHSKLCRLQALIRRGDGSSNDLATVVDEAVTMLLGKLEARRFGKTKAPRRTLEDSDTSASSRNIPAAVKRAVFERDGGRCGFVGANGRRCSCTDPGQLEYHHVHPFGQGGDHNPDNVELRCASHNAYQGELDYGKEVIELAKNSRNHGASRASEGLRTAVWQRTARRPIACATGQSGGVEALPSSGFGFTKGKSTEAEGARLCGKPLAVM